MSLPTRSSTTGFPPMCGPMVEKQYAASVKKGLWKTAYASTNAGEFFAELTMWYFGSRGDFGRIEPHPQEGQEWLRTYDPDGFALLDAIYSGKQKVQRMVWEPLAAHPAKEEAELRPSSPVQPTTVLFDNRTPTDVSIFWIDPQGERKPYGVVRAGRQAREADVHDARLGGGQTGRGRAGDLRCGHQAGKGGPGIGPVVEVSG